MKKEMYRLCTKKIMIERKKTTASIQKRKTL